MSLFRMFVKDAWTLNQRAIANFPLYAGQFGDDYLELHYSRFYSYEIPSNINIGDWCGVYDQFGRVWYGGIIDEINGDEIGVRSMLSEFDNDSLLNWANTGIPYTEQKVKSMIDNFFIANGYHNRQIGNAMTITADSSTQQVELRPVSDKNTIQNIYNIIKEQIDAFGIYPYISLPYAATNVLVSIRTTNKSKITIANNASCILNPTIQEGDIPINTLITKTNYSDGTFSMVGHVLNTDGTYQQTSALMNLALCFQKVRIKYAEIADGEEYTGFTQQQMPPLIYNHEINFDLLLDNNLYDFSSWELGMPMDIWINGQYYDTIMTGWETSFENGGAPSIVRITCGTSRTKLTEVLNNATQ